MIKITFVEPDTQEWRDWKREAQDAITALRAQGPPYLVDEKLYKKQRAAIFAAYFKKCAYCEGHFRLVEAGDVEHFRPKGAVKDEKGKFVYIGTGTERRKHPGYWWLAYEPTNLLPSCSLCNRSGKGNLFPVDGAFRACEPGQEVKELPLLLHPGIGPEDPEQHFVLDPLLGILGSRTRQAQTCIDVFRLNQREELREARKRAYVEVMNAVKTVVSEFRTPGPEYAQLTALLQSHRAGSAAYALAGRNALADCQKSLRALFRTLRPLVKL
jgi:hypothetical protein